MKSRTVILCLVVLSFIASLLAEVAPAPKTEALTPNAVTPAPNTAVTGSNQYGAVTLDAIQATGLIKLNGTSVVGNIHLVGSLICQGAEIGSLDVMGEANLTGTTIKNGGTIIGSLQTVRSTFLKPITVLTQKAVFTATKLEGITVRQDPSLKGKQIIELKQGTLINGPIHFDSGRGEVIVFPGCQVIGVVTGGKVIKKT